MDIHLGCSRIDLMRTLLFLKLVMLLVLGLTVSGCGQSTPDTIIGSGGENHVLIHTPGYLLVGKWIEIRGGESEAVYYSGPTMGPGLPRMHLRRDAIEIHHLPADWSDISIKGTDENIPLVSRGATLATWKSLSQWDTDRILGMCVVVLIATFGVLMVGVSGGPNHGETPFIISLVFLGMFYFMHAAGMATYILVINVVLIVFAIIISAMAMTLTGVKEKRIALAILYPICRGYRSLKTAYPDGPLRFF